MSHTTIEFTSRRMRTANLTESERYSLLSAERRRLVLDILEGRTRPIHLDDIASEVTKRESGLDKSDSETVARVKVTLHHSHLPKMDDFGVLTYDLSSNQISR